MFRSAIFRLTILYLAVIMLISIFFSINLYRISNQEIGNSLQRQQRLYERGMMLGPLEDPNLLQQRDDNIIQARNNLIIQLIYTNVAILFIAGGVSYLFARMTIKPIEEAHERQSRFTSDASHELRSPLAVMRSEIEVSLRDKTSTKTDLSKILSSNLEEVTRMEQLVSGLLELSRENGNITRSEFSAKEVVDEIITKYQKLKNTTITNKVEAGLTITTDRTYLTEILNILVDNAVKYSHDKIDITVASHKHLKQVEISVSDHGIGIRQEDLAHIFDRFYRADRSRSKNEISGYGLGLSIAKKLAELLGGTIVAESEVGKGSTFTVRLPQ